MTDQLIAKLEAAESSDWQLSDEVLRALGWRVKRLSWGGIICRDPSGRDRDKEYQGEIPSPAEYVGDVLALFEDETEAIEAMYEALDAVARRGYMPGLMADALARQLCVELIARTPTTPER